MAKKAGISHTSILNDITQGIYKPVYLLMGDESYFIDQIANALESTVLTEEEKAFNFMTIYGKESDMAQIVTQARQFPMMSEYQLIIVKEAQHIKNFEALSSYLKQPQLSTILVICHKHGSIDKRKKVIKDVAQQGLVYESKKLYDNQVAPWIMEYCKNQRIKINIRDASIFAEYVGNDLSRIVNEVDKLQVILKRQKSNTINGQIIEKYIGVSKDYNNFELTSALGIKDVMKANRIINYFAKDPKNHPLVVTTTVLFNFYNNLLYFFWLKSKGISDKTSIATALKVNPYFVKDYETASRFYTSGQALHALGVLRQLDAQSKGFGGSRQSTERDLLLEAIYKIMH